MTEVMAAIELPKATGNGTGNSDKPPTHVVPMLVTPAMALAWLERNKVNRKIRPYVVEKYAKDMAAGRWRMNGETLSFDADGNLANGQHRLNAIVTANVPVLLLIAFNVEGMETIDQPILRTGYDSMSMHYGQPMKIRHAIAMAMLSPSVTGKRTGSLTLTEKCEFYNAHRDAIDFAAEVGRGHAKYCSRATVLAVFARAWYHEDHDRIERFATLLGGVGAMAEEDTAAGVLFRVLVRNPRRMELHQKTEACLSAFCAYKPLLRTYGLTKEVYPYPGESDES